MNAEVWHVPARVEGRILVRRARANARAAKVPGTSTDESRGEDPSLPLSQVPGTLVGFHGYANNAEVLFEELERIPGVDGWNLVSVQALHPFYRRSTGEVVASWMTRLDRQAAIESNLAYVEATAERCRAELGDIGRLVFLGFSQGAAMAYRAAAFAACDGLVVLGGDVPPELRRPPVELPKTLLARGTEDASYTGDQFVEDTSTLRTLGASVEICEYVGGHEWTVEVHERVGQFLIRL